MTTFQAQPLFMPVSSYIGRFFPIRNSFSSKAIYISFFLSLFLVPTLCFTQRARLDSLKKVLPSLHDSARVDCLNELSGSYIELNNDTAAYCSIGFGRSFKKNYIH